MVAYSFQPRFVDPIRCGLGIDQFLVATGEVVPKRQTIRAVGLRRHARPCEELQLYTGLRSKRARLIGRARCTSVAGICIFLGRGVVSIDDYPAIRDGDLDAFAQQDGFSDWYGASGVAGVSEICLRLRETRT